MAPDSTEDHHNEIRGYKSTISNPKTSDEAKEHAQEKLKELDPENPDHKNKQVDLEGKDPSHVISGLKAATKNPHVSDEAKQNAQENLDKIEEGHFHKG